jgi:hypothetical protein
VDVSINSLPQRAKPGTTACFSSSSMMAMALGVLDLDFASFIPTCSHQGKMTIV